MKLLQICIIQSILCHVVASLFYLILLDNTINHKTGTLKLPEEKLNETIFNNRFSGKSSGSLFKMILFLDYQHNI